MTSNRRDFVRGGLASAAGLVAARAALGAPGPQHEHRPPPAAKKTTTVAVPVEAPDLPTMPWRLEDGVKVFEITCDVTARRFVPWREPFNVWGYNGSMPGPTIEAAEGDRVRFVVTNNLPEATALHWHGLEVPLEMDGVPGVTQDPIPPGGQFVYEFTLHQHGTFFYHSHMPMQEMLGLIGLFVIHPRRPYAPQVDRDFGLIFQEWAILPNNQTPNTLSMEFNWLTINGVAGPATTPLLVKQGERVRLRMVNLGMDHHPIHLHGHQWQVVGTEAGRIPESAWMPGNTVLLGVAQARDVEFEARYLGDWMLHCHLPHHMMNHMASMVGPVSDPGPGVGTGQTMERGMGMLHGGHALGEGNGPSMGRTLGSGAAEEAASHLLGPGQEGGHAGGAQHVIAAPNARQVPGFPQDMHMVEDAPFVNKPECWGLRPTWSAGMMGMMTLVRILPADLYDQIQELKAALARDPAFRLPPPPPRERFLDRKLALVEPPAERDANGHEHDHGGGGQ
jgi:hypothetical protein